MHRTRITINASFAEEVGEEGVAAYIETLVQVAGRAHGQPPSQVASDLRDGLDSRGIAIDKVTAEHLAEQLADPTSGELVVLGPDGTPLHGIPLDGDRDPAEQEEPEDPRRPFYS